MHHTLNDRPIMLHMRTRKHPEYQYLNLMQRILSEGCRRGDRTGTGTLAVFDAMMVFDLTQGFPLLTTKQISWKTAFREMLWMLRGETNIRSLVADKVHIWTDWPLVRYWRETGEQISEAVFEQRILDDDVFAAKWGELGPVYGKQWRAWETKDGRVIDQLADVIQKLKTNPECRRNIMEGWNVGEIEAMSKCGLPPCHKTYQFMVDTNTNELTVSMSQRSTDTFLGLPYNIANTALMAHLAAAYTGLKAKSIVWYGVGDTHIYLNHLDQVAEQLSRMPRAFPELRLNKLRENLWDTRMEDIEIVGYDPYPKIAAPVAV